MNQDKINKIEKIGSLADILYEKGLKGFSPNETIAFTMKDKINELIDALQDEPECKELRFTGTNSMDRMGKLRVGRNTEVKDEPEDTKHELYPVCRDDVEVVSKAYKDGYQQAIRDAIAAVPDRSRFIMIPNIPDDLTRRRGE